MSDDDENTQQGQQQTQAQPTPQERPPDRRLEYQELIDTEKRSTDTSRILRKSPDHHQRPAK